MAQSEKQREDIMQREYQSMAPDTVEDKNGAENKIKKTKKIPGYRLINRIKSRSIELGVQDRYIADIIGVTPIYWYSIANGHRKISALSKDKLEKIDQLAYNYGISRSEFINQCVDFAMEHMPEFKKPNP